MMAMTPNRMGEGYYGRVFPADELYAYVYELVARAEMHESLRALSYMRRMHEGHTRNDGQRYEVHPLSMALMALALRPFSMRGDGALMIDDAAIAVFLLHDVPEEAKIAVGSMPFSDEVLRGVEYMTVPDILEGETVFKMKQRYTRGWLEDWRASLGKGLDTGQNLSTMTLSTFSVDKIRKNVVETDLLRMPVFRAAGEKYLDLKLVLLAIQDYIKSSLHHLAIHYGVKLTDPNFVNPPYAKDYSYLVTGGEPS